MTSLSTIIGVLPLIISFGPGAASRLTVGITIFGGMLFSTFFTLVCNTNHLYNNWKKYQKD